MERLYWRWLIGTLLLFLIVFPSGTVGGGELTGEEIVRKAHELERPQASWAEMKMTLVNRKGKIRVRKMEVWSKKFGDRSKSLTRFHEPPEVQGAGFLSWEVPGGRDDQFIYLPEVKRVRRIAAGQRNMSFMNSDFTYADMERRGVEEDIHTLLGEENVLGQACYKIQSVPRNPENSPYRRVIHWIRKDIFVPIRAEFYNQNDQLQKHLIVEQLEREGKYWVSRRVVMEDLEKQHKTILEMTAFRYDLEIPDEYFTERYLEKP